MKNYLLLGLFFSALVHNTFAQIKLGESFSLSTYGRLGISSALYGERYGSRLNLTGQGSIGGRHEESDYMEIAPTVHLKPLLKYDSKGPNINIVLRWAFFSGNNTFIASQTGITMAEAYVQVDSLLSGKAKNVSMWVGQRFYRSFYVSICDYFFFNNFTSQGAGFAYQGFKAAILTHVPFSATGNPYSDLKDPFYQRVMFNLQQQIILNTSHKLHLLSEIEFHGLEENDTLAADIGGNDYGIAAGVLHEWTGDRGDKNFFSVRYGSGIANGPGDDGWSSRTFITYGNPNSSGQFAGAYGLNIVESFQLNHGEKYNMEAYGIYRYAQGSDAPIEVPSYARSNKKQDFTIGTRVTRFITNRFHLIGEVHYQTRQYFTNVDANGHYSEIGWGSMTKFTLIPTLVPTGKRSQNARPHLRLVYSVALYNDLAKQYQLSDYLIYNAGAKVGMYLGIKTEWWF